MIPRLPEKPDWNAAALEEASNAMHLYRNATLEGAASHLRGSLVYLATPYTRLATGADGEWSSQGSIKAGVGASFWSAKLALIGVTAISPVILAGNMVHAPWQSDFDPLDHEFWMNWCRPLLNQSAAVVIPPIPGWDESLGVWQEANAALWGMRRVYLIAEDGELG